MVQSSPTGANAKLPLPPLAPTPALGQLNKQPTPPPSSGFCFGEKYSGEPLALIAPYLKVMNMGMMITCANVQNH